MSVEKARLRRLERRMGITSWLVLRPLDCSIETWRSIGRKLVELPSFAFHPYRDVQDVLTWLSQQRPEALQNCPGPVLQASCWVEAEEAGEEFEPIDFHGMSDQELQEIIDQAEA